MIALDATYSLGANLSGVGVYSREILHGLAALDRNVEWQWFYRPNRYLRAEHTPSNVRKKLLLESIGSRSASLFHGLNQRLPRHRFRRQVATFHDLFVISGEYSTPEFRQRFTEQARHAAATADLVIAVSQFTADQVTKYLGVSSKKIRVIHHGIVPRRLPDVPKEQMVLCVGALQRRKNQATLVRAFETMPSDWTLVLAGSEGFESAETVQAIARSSTRDRIQVTGYVTETKVAELYARASIFAFPSLDEGFGMPVLESMAAGVPVVAGNRSALPEICGGAAVLVDPESTEEIGNALRQLAANQELREQMVRLGLARAGLFSWQKAVAKTAGVYRELA